MRIGQLAEYTGTSRRLLRYYEEQGLIAAVRQANGYRDYDAAYVEKVLQIRELLAIGLPTRVIRQILPCLNRPHSIDFTDATPETLDALERERDRMTERLHVLERNRDAISDYLELVRAAAHPSALPDAAAAAA